MQSAAVLNQVEERTFATRGTMFVLIALMTFASTLRADMPFVRVAKDNAGFVLDPGGQRFVPWGLNYGNGGRLIEDFWETDPATVENDLRTMMQAGANVTRVHLQFGKFMSDAQTPNPEALEYLAKLLKQAESAGIYLDLTGLACYRPADVPRWYDGLDETQRWAAQARFWKAIAHTCANSPAVLCYDLMNEPIVPGDRRAAGQWYSGKLLGEYDFVQFITLEPAGRPRDQVARDWIRTIRAAITPEDSKHLVTVGLLPWVPQWGHLSGFIPETVAPELDYISVHTYPEAGKVPEALAGLHRFAVGKPVVIEETFPLACPAADLRQFLLESRKDAQGWIGHFDGKTAAQLKAKPNRTIADELWLAWMSLFEELKPKMTAAR